MKKLLLFVLLILIINKVIAQEKKETIYSYVEQMPEFNGGKENDINSFINSHLQYPKEAIDSNIEGRVVVKFIITKEGKVQAPTIVKHVHPLLDSAAVSVIMQTDGMWIPGKKNGENVSVYSTLPVKFEYKIDTVIINNNVDENRNTEEISNNIEMPHFVDGQNALSKLIDDNLKYPESAKDKLCQGKVRIKFFVNTDSTINEISIYDGNCKSLEQEAIRVIKLTNGKWIPATKNGIPFRQFLIMPFNFKLLQKKISNDIFQGYTVSYSSFPTRKLSDSEQANYYFHEGMEIYKNKNIEHATDYFVKAYQINPNDSESLYYITLIQFQLGKTTEGCKLIESLKRHHHPKAEELAEKYCVKKKE